MKTKSGNADWKATLSRKLISLQNADGSWAKTASGRWMESDPSSSPPTPSSPWSRC